MIANFFGPRLVFVVDFDTTLFDNERYKEAGQVIKNLLDKSREIPRLSTAWIPT